MIYKTIQIKLQSGDKLVTMMLKLIPPVIPHDSEKSHEGDPLYSTTGYYRRTHQPDEEGSPHWPTLGRLNCHERGITLTA